MGVKKRSREMEQLTKNGSIRKVVLRILILSIIWFMIHIVFITIDGLNDELGYVDVAVVLGNKIEENGEPSNRLKSRLDKAIELYEEKFFDYIIVSGGVGKEGFDEAVVMKEYLVNEGIDEESILVDSKGNNTMFTAENTKGMMDEYDFDSVMIITQFYHISRCKLAFSKVGFEEAYSAHSQHYELRDIYSIFREFIGYYKYRFYY
jgi:vancomycin permeability regulator SanA